MRNSWMRIKSITHAYRYSLLRIALVATLLLGGLTAWVQEGSSTSAKRGRWFSSYYQGRSYSAKKSHKSYKSSRNQKSDETKQSTVAKEPAKPAQVPASPTVEASSVAPTPPSANGKALLIKHGWDIPPASTVAQNYMSMEKMPFDGVVMKLGVGPNGALSSKIQSTTPLSYEKMKEALSPLTKVKFTTLKHNFVIVYATPAGDIFDSGYNTVINNFANLAKAAKETGVEGIFFDNEEYYGDSMEYGSNCNKSRYTLAQCRDQAYLRGNQIMNAIKANWPEAKVLLAHGPYLSDSASYRYLSSNGVVTGDSSTTHPLYGPFAVGMAAATVGNASQFIDGGEIYTLRTAEQFRTMKYWQKQGMAASSSLIPSALRPHWANTVSASFGIYDRVVPSYRTPMNSDIWQSTLTNALNTADHYVWAYSEEYDWWNTGFPAKPVPAAWVEATRKAREATR